jgi:hypothetical protein
MPIKSFLISIPLSMKPTAGMLAREVGQGKGPDAPNGVFTSEVL